MCNLCTAFFVSVKGKHVWFVVLFVLVTNVISGKLFFPK